MAAAWTPRAGNSDKAGNDPVCAVREHPVPRSTWERMNPPGGRVLNRIEMCVPAPAYGDNPREMLPRHSTPDQNQFWALSFSLLGYLANHITIPLELQLDGPRRPRPKKKATEEGEEGSDSDDDAWSANEVFCTMECVPHRDNPLHIVAYRYRVTEVYSGEYRTNMCVALQTLINKNDRDAVRRLTKNQRDPANLGTNFAGVTTPQWQRLVQWYTQNLHLEEAGNDPPLIDGDIYPHLPRLPDQSMDEVNVPRGDPSVPLAYRHSAWNLATVFSLERSALKCARLGAHPRYCNFTEIYQHGHFADPNTLWRFGEQMLVPSKLERMRHPMFSVDERLYGEAAKQWEREAGPGTKHQFKATCVVTTASEAYDHHFMRNLVTREKTALRAKWAGRDDEFQNNLRREWQPKAREFARAMNNVISATGDAPPAVRAIAKWGAAFLEEHNGSFCLAPPKSRLYCNLGRSATFWARQGPVLETVATTRTSHRICLLRIYQGLSVTRRYEMGLHDLNLGPAAAGKSYAAKLMALLLIPGTVEIMVGFSLNAFLAPGPDGRRGNTMDCMVVVLDDGQSSQLGAGNGKNVSTDMEAVMKNLLTAREVKKLVCETDPRRTTLMVADAAVCMIVHMNAWSSSIDHAMKNRYMVHIWTDERRDASEGPDDAAAYARSEEPAVKAAMEETSTYWRRNQVLITWFHHLVDCDIIDTPNLLVPKWLQSMLGLELRAFGVDISKPAMRRDTTRLLMLIEVDTWVDVINLFWDSEQSPIRGQPHHPDHFVQASKLAVAHVHNWVKNVGVMYDAWVDQVRASVLQTMARTLFRDSARKAAQAERPLDRCEDLEGDPMEDDGPSAAAPRAPMVPLGYPVGKPEHRWSDVERAVVQSVQGRRYQKQMADYERHHDEEQNWMYDTLEFGVELPPPKASRGNIASDDDVLQHLATYLWNNMSPRPLQQEVLGVLQQLRKEEIAVERTINNPLTRQEYTETRKNMPVLVLAPNRVRMALRMLKHAEQRDILYTCVKNVLQKLVDCNGIRIPKGQQEITYMYGESHAHDPYIPRQITLRRTAAEPGEAPRVWNANWFEPAMRAATMDFLSMMGAEAGANLFSDDETPWSVPDTDLDAMAEQQHANLLGLHPDDQNAAPSMHLQHTEAAYRRLPLADEASRCIFPDCFRRMSQKAAWRREQEAHAQQRPGDYSMRTQYEKRRRFEQGFERESVRARAAMARQAGTD